MLIKVIKINQLKLMQIKGENTSQKYRKLMQKAGKKFQRKKINPNLTKIQEADVEGYSSYRDHHP